MSMSKTVCTSRFRAKALHTTRRLVNALVLLVAGTRVFPLYGVIKHPGRRWGAVVARATRDRFVVPMPWGESTDWHRNVRAAGECIVRWKGRDYPVRPPEVMEVAAAKVSVRGGGADSDDAPRNYPLLAAALWKLERGALRSAGDCTNPNPKIAGA